MRKKLYLANQYGFSKQTKNLLHEFIEIFKDLNLEVYEPFERAKSLTQQKSQWAYEVANSNFHDLKECDCIFAIVNGSALSKGSNTSIFKSLKISINSFKSVLVCFENPYGFAKYNFFLKLNLFF